MAGAAGIDARLFDGQSSRPVPVRLQVAGAGVDLLFLDDSGRRERLSLADLRWHEPLGATRRVDLPGGRSCEVLQGPALSAFLAASGHRERAITVWQGSGHRVLIAIVLLLLVGFAGYRWGLPLVARAVAVALPQPAVDALDGHVIDALDKTRLLKPTGLSAARRAGIEAAVAPLLAARSRPDPVHLHFRDAPDIGANAFALPGGDVVVTDALVKLAPDDAHVAAVIAHELGHVHYRHGLRNLIQASLLAAVVSLWTGDVSTLATGGATVLLNSAYSRDFEREADDYGAALLRKTGQSPLLLADMLDALTRQAVKDGKIDADAADGHWSDYLSSHPSTPERIERLRRASAS
ncbi:M48 family metallopeptidase [Nitrogeniibacter mangrovi]|uniref:M48 family metallopeptidase n=1 Tax=Nitrogeniibacter mangrovi TaxID=2016596 RepID=A0A6C1B8Y3_9RHOO|nr:M48 family metallopeptidase [Nitrogeniibacter mangrovi]QID19419.1 M48 family metallopeptidase [Nitrogeniibacter mangrovi]